MTCPSSWHTYLFPGVHSKNIYTFFPRAVDLSKQGCMIAMVFDFSILDWIKVDKCFYRLENVPIDMFSGIMLRSASYFNKNAEL